MVYIPCAAFDLGATAYDGRNQFLGIREGNVVRLLHSLADLLQLQANDRAQRSIINRVIGNNDEAPEEGRLEYLAQLWSQRFRKSGRIRSRLRIGAELHQM